MWRSQLDGRTLHFLYAGSNNQNFVLRDAETGTWWQQVTGEAIIGPWKGKRLEPFTWSEVNFGIFRSEHPDGLVLRPDDGPIGRYPFARYRLPEAEQARGRPRPEWHRPDPEVALEEHDLVVGVQVGERAKAYPLDSLIAQNPIQDRLGGVPLLIVVAADGKSARAFDRTVGGRVLNLYAVGSGPPVLLDEQTGSIWDFSGTAIDGELAGQRLRRIQTVRDYWFDWRRHHPNGSVYLLGG